MPTPHHHWSPYDIDGEMRAFDALHARVKAGVSELSEEAAVLRGKARSCGFAEADAYLCEHGLEAPYDAQGRAARQAFDRYRDNQYLDYVDRSETILLRVSPDEGTRLAVAALSAGMREGYDEGLAERVEEARAGAPSP